MYLPNVNSNRNCERNSWGWGKRYDRTEGGARRRPAHKRRKWAGRGRAGDVRSIVAHANDVVTRQDLWGTGTAWTDYT
jgi:hypothetical protein